MKFLQTYRVLSGVGLILVMLWPAAQAAPAGAQSAANAASEHALRNVLQLSASGQVEVPQDLLTLTLTTSHEGSSAAAVQAELSRAAEAALTEVKKMAQPGQMDVRSGDFSVYPVYGRDNKVTAWQGRAEVVLKGRDFPRITQAAARAGAMAIGQVSFDLSTEARLKAESEAQAQAIDRFKAKAAEIARQFGFGGHTLREASVSSADGWLPSRTARLNKSSKVSLSSASSPAPMEPGKSVVEVTVTGSVQAH
ncbi:SIMPL domain-containing protein [Ottowia sp.]|uniref:SIMPL domain-containing protein n=1 Tax=Ottowia sp. TaxID=1898956 RepID=UPI003A856B1B